MMEDRMLQKVTTPAIKIEKGVPIPPPRPGTNTYPLADMKVGDSFLVPYKPGRSPGSSQAMIATHARVWRNRKGNGWTFTTRQEADGTRIWRTA